MSCFCAYNNGRRSVPGLFCSSRRLGVKTFSSNAMAGPGAKEYAAVIKHSARCTGPACVKPVSVFSTGSTYSRKAASIRVWAGREGSASGCRNRSLF